LIVAARKPLIALGENEVLWWLLHNAADLVLIYEKPDVHTLRLVRLGSHSELGL